MVCFSYVLDEEEVSRNDLIATHAFLAQSGLKWIVRQIFPPRYIFEVLPE